MTLAELLSTVEHAKEKADDAKIPYHKVEVKVRPVTFREDTLDLYPGKMDVEKAVLNFEAE